MPFSRVLSYAKIKKNKDFRVLRKTICVLFYFPVSNNIGQPPVATLIQSDRPMVLTQQLQNGMPPNAVYYQQQPPPRLLAPSYPPPSSSSPHAATAAAAPAATSIPRAAGASGNVSAMPAYYAQPHVVRGSNVVRVVHQLPSAAAATGAPPQPVHAGEQQPQQPTTELGQLQTAYASNNGIAIPPFDNPSLALLEHLHPADVYAQRRLAGARYRHNQALMFEIFNTDIVGSDPETPTIATESRMQTLRQQVADLEAQRTKVQQEIQELEQMHAARRQKLQMFSVNSAEQSEQNNLFSASRAKNINVTPEVFADMIDKAYLELVKVDREAQEQQQRQRELEERQQRENEQKQQAAADEQAEQDLTRKSRQNGNKSPVPAAASKSAAASSTKSAAAGGGVAKKRGRANVTARKVAP